MDFEEFLKQSRKIREEYTQLNRAKGQREWSFVQRTEALAGDIGDLMKMVMAKAGYREFPELEKNLRHELIDCLWAVFSISDELGVRLEDEVGPWMKEMHERITKEKQRVVK